METDLSATTLVRIAHLIRQQLFALRLSGLASVLCQADHLFDNVGRLQGAGRRLSICLDRNWAGAGRKVLDQLESSVRGLPYHAGQIQQACEGCNLKIPSVREVVEDLQQLGEEFDRVQFSLKEQALAVVIYTASIAAGLGVSQFAKWLRGLPVEPDTALNLLTAEFACTG